MSKIKKMSKITGSIGCLFNRESIYYLAVITNEQSDAINYLLDVVEGLENRVKELEQAGEHHD